MPNELLSEVRAHPKRALWLLPVFLLWALLEHDALSWANGKLNESVGSPMTIILKLVQAVAGWSVNHPVELFLVFTAVYVLWILIRAQISTGNLRLWFSHPAHTISAESLEWTGPVDNWKSVQDGVYGLVMQVSRQHLPLYLAEFDHCPHSHCL
jgi:hypothetical protein